MRLKQLLSLREGITFEHKQQILDKVKRFTSRDFDLYTSMPGHTAAGRELAFALHKALQMDNVTKAEAFMRAAMLECADFGSFDTEPRDLVNHYIHLVFADY